MTDISFDDLIPAKKQKPVADLSFDDLIPAPKATIPSPAAQWRLGPKGTGERIPATYDETGMPPKGMIINTENGSVLYKGEGQFVPIDEAQARVRARVDGEQAAHPIMMGIDNAVRSAARGVPFVGAGVDRLSAGASALAGGDYGQELAYQQTRDAMYDEQHPIASLGGKVAGGIAGTVVAAPLLPAKVGGYLLGTGGTSTGNAIVRGTMAGATQGAASGAGSSPDLADGRTVARNAAQGAGTGAFIGAAIPAVVGSARFVRGGNEDALTGLTPRATKWLIKQSDPGKIQQQQAEMARLGPDAVMADVSPAMMGVARGTAARPEGRNMIVDALMARNAGKNARIGNVIDNELGPDVTPSQVSNEIANVRKDLVPKYELALKDARAVDTSAIADQIASTIPDVRGPALKKLREVRSYLDIPGTNELDPSPRALLETRKAIDGLMGNEADANVLRVLGNVRKAVDNEIADKIPGIKDVDAFYADTFAQDEALKFGKTVFENGKNAIRPQELSDKMRNFASEGQIIGPSQAPLRLRQSARADIGRIVGTNANDVSALKRLLRGEGDWNRAKLEELFGKQKAEKVLNILDAEEVFQNTANRVTAGSDTGMTNSFNKFLEESGNKLPKFDAGSTAFGAALGGGRWAISKVLGNRAAANANNAAEQLGRLSISKGSEASAVLEALLARAQRQGALNKITGASGGSAGATNQVINALISRDQSINRNR